MLMLLKFDITLFYWNIFWSIYYSCDNKAEFSASSLLSSGPHDPSEIILKCWFSVQETFLIIINAENSFAASYFVETMMHFFRIL